MSTRNNDVTLFSNGIGHFRRHYKVGAEGQAISIPFKKDHIGDVAASLQVFGSVRLNTPPSFTPSNANATALRVNPHSAFQSLLSSLSGSLVKVTQTNSSVLEYTLLGIEHQNVAGPNGESVDKPFAILSNPNGGITRISFDHIKDIEFTEDSVKAEINKALKNNFQQIKPESTSLDLSVTPLEGKSEADTTIQYTIPVAAWKMRYSIREDKGKFVLEGSAIIDNNTDEDWDNFRVSVVTGNPISFNTDIATVVVPQRKYIRLVDSEVLGNVEVQEAYGDMPVAGLQAMSCTPANSGRARLSTRGFSKSSISNYSQAGFESTFGDAIDEDTDADGPLAATPGVDSKEVGDFCVFTSKEPITILARKSAVVPMFTIALAKAGVILLYKESNHATRPYRAVKFKNESEYSLGKGKTVIYNEGVFSGECVLEMTKPGENRMLPHCLENGVKIVKENKGHETRRASLKISDSVGVIEDVSTALTHYVLENKKDETFKMAVEHSNALGVNPNLMVEFEGVEFKDKEKLSNGSGYRLYFDLAPKQTVTIKVTETLLVQNKVNIGGSFHWIKSNIIDTKNSIAKDATILAAMKIQKNIDEVNLEIRQSQNRRQELESQNVRVRNNIGSTKDIGNSSTIANWVKDLDEAETEIRQIDKTTLPSLTEKSRKLQEALVEEIGKITVSWKA